MTNRFAEFSTAPKANRFAEFKVNTDPAQDAPDQRESRGIVGVTKDLGASFAGGANSLLELGGSLYGLATGDMENFAREQGARGREYWNERKTPQLKQLEEDRKAKIDAAEGEWAKMGTAAWSTLSSPSLLASYTLEQIPNLLVTGGAGRIAGEAVKAGLKKSGQEVSEKLVERAAVAGAVGAGASMQGSDVGGQAYEQLLALPDEIWLANPDLQARINGNMDLFPAAKREIATELAQNSAIASGIVSIGVNSIPLFRIMEQRLVGAKSGPGSMLGGAAKGFAGESVGEAIEEGSGVAISNVATAQVDPLQSLAEGVGEAAGMGLAAGPMGAVAGASGRQSRAGEADVARTIFEAPESADELQDTGFTAQKPEDELDSAIDNADRAATDTLNRGGDALDAEIARAGTEEIELPQAVLNARATARRLYSDPVTAPESSLTVPGQMPDFPRTQSPASDQTIPGQWNQPSATSTLTPSESTPVDAMILAARKAGDETSAARLEAAKRMQALSERFASEGNDQRAANMAERAQVIIEDVKGKLPVEETQAPELPAQSGERISVWTGRRGDGYETQEAAEAGLATRKRMRADLDWRIELMPSGKYQLAGYATERQARDRLAQPDMQAVDTLQQARTQGETSRANQLNPAVRDMRGAAIDRAMRSIESRKGVATQAEADLLAEYGMGKPYDRVMEAPQNAQETRSTKPATDVLASLDRLAEPTGVRVVKMSSGEAFPSEDYARKSLPFRSNPGARIVPSDDGGVVIEIPERADQGAEWRKFAPETGTLNVPRETMPQIKAEHRGAMVNFLKGRFISSEKESVAANTLKPTQTEFSPAKVKQALEYEGGNRSILVSSDNYVVDGHHQWLAGLDGDIQVIRIDAPIQEILEVIQEFPSATTGEATPDGNYSAQLVSFAKKAKSLKEVRDYAVKRFGPRSLKALDQAITGAWNIRNQEQRKKIKDSDTISVAVAKLGGIKPEWQQDITGDTTMNKMVPGVGRVFTQTGTSPDDMALKLLEEGYITQAQYDDMDGRDALYEALNDDLSGRRKVYRVDSLKAQEEQLQALEDQYADEIAQLENQREQKYRDIEQEHGTETAELARLWDIAADQAVDRLIEDAAIYEEQIQEIENVRQSSAEADLNPEDRAASDERVRQTPEEANRQPAEAGRGQAQAGADPRVNKQSESDGQINEPDSSNISSGQRDESGLRQPAPDAGRGQLELFMPEGSTEQETREAYADLYGTIVVPRTVQTLKSAVDTITSESDLAHLMAHLRKDPQENFFAVATGNNNEILRVMKYTRGTRNASSVYPMDVLAEASSIDGIRTLHFVHNHPSGSTEASDSDKRITDRIQDGLDGTGIRPGFHVIVAGTNYGSVYSNDGLSVGATGVIAPRARTKSIPVSERRFTKMGAFSGPITDSEKAVEATKMLSDSIVLLSNQYAPVAIIKMSAKEMQELRSGGRVRRILSAIGKSNAAAAIIRTSDEAAAANVSSFLNSFGGEISVLDWIDDNGRSDSSSGFTVTRSKSAFFSKSDEAPALTTPKLIEWSSEIKKKYNLGSLSVFLNGNDIELLDISVPEASRGSGAGSAVMTELTALADRHGKKIVLSPESEKGRRGTTSRIRLVKFYKRFGFVENKGRDKDFTVSESMYREPRSGTSKALFQQVYHGTPHTFDKFSLDAIGTGEGAQAYGWGLYFAGKRGIAEYYRKTLAEKLSEDAAAQVIERNKPAGSKTVAHKLLVAFQTVKHFNSDDLVKIGIEPENLGFEDIDDEVSIRGIIHRNFGAEDYIKGVKGVDVYQMRDGSVITDTDGELKALDGELGNLYQADIPEDSELLDWDKPLSEQPAMVKKLKSLTAEFSDLAEQLQSFELSASTGRSVYYAISRMIGNDLDLQNKYGVTERTGSAYDKAASMILNDVGIPGLRYLDGSSRSAGEGGHNYVIWDESRVTVEAINDELRQAMRASRGLDPSSGRLIAAKGKSGTTATTVTRSIAKSIEKLQAELDVTVVQSIDELPRNLRVQIPANTRIKGAYWNNSVYLVADNIESMRDAQVVLAHELVGHKGVLEMIGEDATQVLKTEIDRLLKMKSRTAQSIAEEVDRRYGTTRDDSWHAEFMAIAAERREKDGPIASLMRTLREYILRALKAFGLNGPFSVSELDIMLSDAERYLSGRRETQGVRAGAMASQQGFDLDQYTEQDIAGRQKAQTDLEKAEALRQQRQQADDQVDDFTLTGSNSEADQAAARGQQSMFSMGGKRDVMVMDDESKEDIAAWIVDMIDKDEGGVFGLRMIPAGFEVRAGDDLPDSYTWDAENDTPSGASKGGVSTIGIENWPEVEDVLYGIELVNNYAGRQIVLARGSSLGRNDLEEGDRGEMVIADPVVVRAWGNGKGNEKFYSDGSDTALRGQGSLFSQEAGSSAFGYTKTNGVWVDEFGDRDTVAHMTDRVAEQISAVDSMIKDESQNAAYHASRILPDILYARENGIRVSDLAVKRIQKAAARYQPPAAERLIRNLDEQTPEQKQIMFYEMEIPHQQDMLDWLKGDAIRADGTALPEMDRRRGIKKAEAKLKEMRAEMARLKSGEKISDVFPEGPGDAMFSKAPATDSKAFQDWLGDSKVVDENGEPLVVYHQTSKNSEQKILESGFTTAYPLARRNDEQVPDGIFFKPTTDDIKVGSHVKDEITQIPVYLSIQKPFVVKSRENIENALGDETYSELARQARELDRQLSAEFDEQWNRLSEKRVSAGVRKISDEEWDSFSDDWQGRVDTQIPAASAAARDRLTAVLAERGFDGMIIEEDRGSWGRSTKTYIALRSEQVKSATRNRGTFDPKNPNILFSKDDSTGFAIPDETLVSVAVRKMQDKFKVLKDLQANIIKAGGDIDENNNAYLAEELFHGKAENDIRQMQEQYVEPLAKKMAQFDISRDQLDQFLYARHARERNARIAEINPEMPDGGSGMTNAQARAKLDEVRATGKQGQYEQLAGIVYDMLQLQRDMVREGGLESDPTIDAWEEGYEFYVPLKGWAQDTKQEGMPRTGKGFAISGRESKRALGRSSQAASPTSFAINDLTEKLIRRRKNEVGNAFLKLVQANPNPEYWQVFTDEKPETQRSVKKVKDPQTGEMVEQVTETAIPMAMLTDRYFTTKKNGKTFYIKLEDPRLMKAMKNIGPESNGALIRTMAGMTRILSALNTSYSPEFMVSNFARDVQTALLNMQAEQSLPGGKAAGVKIAKKTMKDIPKAMKAIYGALRGTEGKTAEAKRWQALFEQFRSDGAKTGWFDMKDLDGQSKSLDNLVAMAQGGFKGKAMLWARESAKLVENMNQSVENAVRLAAYANALEAGISRKNAASLAKNMTVNFNRRGEIGTVLNAIYMFANASVQGTANFIRTMGTLKGEGGPTWDNLNNAQKIAVGMMAGAYFIGLANRSSAGEDEDDENWYDKVPDYVKERNIVIMKSLFGGAQDGSYWKIPLPYGYNVFYVLGNAIEAVTGGGKSVSQSAGDVTLAALGSFSPIGFQQSDSGANMVLKNAAPTIIKPIVEVALNENFMGSSIYTENLPFGTPRPDSALGRNSTPEAYRALSRWLNEVTGGSEYQPGAVDINPDVMQHFLDFFGGSAYAFFGSKVPDAVHRAAAGVVAEENRVPFLSRISGKVLPYADTEKFYQRRDVINQVYDEYRAIPAAERSSFEQAQLLKMRPLLKATERRLSALRKVRDRIYSTDLSLRERDPQLKEVETDMKAAIDRFNKAYSAIDR